MNCLFGDSKVRFAMKTFLGALALVLIFTGFAWAQAETGQITGTVTDPSGGVVANVTVTIRNAATNGVRIETTDSKGYYAATNLQPSDYTVTVEVTGFQKQSKKVTVLVGAKVGLDFTLTLGSSSTTVEVSAEAASQINTETATISTNITSNMVSQLPSLTRDPYDFAKGAPGAVDTPPGQSSRGVNVALNGMRNSDSNVLLDGAANNDEFDTTVGDRVPLDSVQEYSVMTNSWTAEYGRATAGVINLVTKSGSNKLHGTAYEFNRVSDLAANDYYNNANDLAKPHFTRNDFGFSVGGPIVKDKLFFFANPEWNRTRSYAQNIGWIADPALVAASNANTSGFFAAAPALRSDVKILGTSSAQDFGIAGTTDGSGNLTTPPALCYPIPAPTLPVGNPTYYDPNACKGAAYTYSATAPLMDQFQYQSPGDSGAGAPTNWLNLVGRIDWNVSPKNNFYARYAILNENDFNGYVNTSPYVGYETGQLIRNQNILLSFTSAYTPHWVSQSKVVYNRLKTIQPLGANVPGPTLYLDSSNTASTLGGYDVAFPGYAQYTPGNAIPFGGPQNYYMAYQDMSYTHGAHTWRFGGSYDFLNDNRTFGAYEEAVELLDITGSAYNGFARMLDGQLRRFQTAVDPQGHYPCTVTVTGAVSTRNVTPQCSVTLPVGPPDFSRSNRYNEFSVYGMDEWKVSKRVTLNLGMRWEYFGVQHNKNQQLDSNFYLGGGSSIFQQIGNGGVAVAPNSPIHGLWSPDYKDFSPRLGFAYDLFGDGKTSLRGGYGISYVRNFGNVTFNMIQNPPNYAVLSVDTSVAAPLPLYTNNFGPLGGSTTPTCDTPPCTLPLPTVSLRNVEQNIKTEYAHQYSLSIQRELAANLVVSADYSGSKGARIYDLADINMQGMGPVYLGTPCTTGGTFNGGDCAVRLVQSGQYSTINRRGSGGSSSYNSLNFNATLRNPSMMGHKTGLTLITNFTWAHSLDALSSTFSESAMDWNLGYLNPFNPQLDRGPSEFDVRKRLAVTAIWDVPFASETHGVVKQVFDGWELAPIFTASSGTPFTIFDCTYAWEQCPRVMVTGPVKSTGNGSAVDQGGDNFDYIDFGSLPIDSSYVNPTVGISDFGPFPKTMTGRNYFRGPGLWNLDMGIYKNFSINERFKLQFRGEMYNAFNHPNMYLLVGGSNVIGVSPYVEGQRGNTTNSHRNVQLGLKLIF